MKEKLTELVPTLMKEIEPDLIRYAKESIEDFIVDNNLLLETVKETLLSVDEEVERERAIIGNSQDVIDC